MPNICVLDGRDNPKPNESQQQDLISGLTFRSARDLYLAGLRRTMGKTRRSRSRCDTGEPRHTQPISLQARSRNLGMLLDVLGRRLASDRAKIALSHEACHGTSCVSRLRHHTEGENEFSGHVNASLSVSFTLLCLNCNIIISQPRQMLREGNGTCDIHREETFFTTS